MTSRKISRFAKSVVGEDRQDDTAQRPTQSPPQSCGVVLVVALGLGWQWQKRRASHQSGNQNQQELVELWEDRRDLIPYLLESFRATGSDETVQSLIDLRAQARNAKTFEDTFHEEGNLEQVLTAFLEKYTKDETLNKDLGWLEARTEIQKLTEQIKEKRRAYTS